MDYLHYMVELYPMVMAVELLQGKLKNTSPRDHESSAKFKCRLASGSGKYLVTRQCLMSRGSVLGLDTDTPRAETEDAASESASGARAARPAGSRQQRPSGLARRLWHISHHHKLQHLGKERASAVYIRSQGQTVRQRNTTRRGNEARTFPGTPAPSPSSASTSRCKATTSPHTTSWTTRRCSKKLSKQRFETKASRRRRTSWSSRRP